MYVELCQKHMEHHQPFFAHAQFTRVLNVFDLLEMYCFGACENLRWRRGVGNPHWQICRMSMASTWTLAESFNPMYFWHHYKSKPVHQCYIHWAPWCSPSAHVCVYELLPQLCHHKHDYWSVIVRHIYHSANSPRLFLRTEISSGIFLGGVPPYDHLEGCSILCCLGAKGEWNFVLHSELWLKKIISIILES